MPGSILGNAVPRVEDPDLLTGNTTYIDNLPIDGVLHVAFVRSPLAHGRILSIDTSEAEAMPGVVAVFTADSLGLEPQHGFMVLNEHCARPPLAQGKVRFVGDAVVAVVAETKAQAVDATESVVVDYDPLPAVTDPEAALAPDAPMQFEAVGSNLAASASPKPGDDPLAGADVVVRGRFVNQRVAVVPMEGNAIAVEPHGDAVTVHVSTQMPHGFHRMASKALGLERDSLRVIAPHVGGAFGSKAGMAAEHAIIIAIARKLGRPVKLVETRSENMISMPHGRGQVQYIEMGFTRDGDITGMRCRIVGDAGAYAGFGGALAMGPTRSMAQGVYNIPALSFSAAIALTNTTPMGAFRGA